VIHTNFTPLRHASSQHKLRELEVGDVLMVDTIFVSVRGGAEYNCIGSVLSAGAGIDQAAENTFFLVDCSTPYTSEDDY